VPSQLDRELSDTVGGGEDAETVNRRSAPSKEGIDLVVMAAPPNEGGLTEMLFGRPSQKLLQRLTCSLLTVRL